MENKYEMFINLTAETKKVYEKYFETEGYQLLIKEDTILLAKKQNNTNVNLAHEKSIVQLVLNMAKRYSQVGILYLDLSAEINGILQQSEGKDKLNLTDNYITWPIRQAITRAIMNKGSKKMPKV